MKKDRSELEAEIEQLKLDNAKLQGQIEELRRVVESYQYPLLKVRMKTSSTTPVLPTQTIIKTPQWEEGTIFCGDRAVPPSQNNLFFDHVCIDGAQNMLGCDAGGRTAGCIYCYPMEIVTDHICAGLGCEYCISQGRQQPPRHTCVNADGQLSVTATRVECGPKMRDLSDMNDQPLHDSGLDGSAGLCG